jgi:EAL domain-containing protein (putative c-di-GMP-specific phosphodiesterase class I)
MEALIRWNHPERGILGPFDFLPMIENNDLIVKIGDWVIEQALAHILAWQEQGTELEVSVNVSARQVQDDMFIPKLQNALEKFPQIDSHLLELELLETSALETLEAVKIVMETGKVLGVSFALDDFGTGYSSLSYLKKLPAKTLKIDQTFVRDMLVDLEDQAIVEGIIKLANVFGREVIAEGVETDQHGQRLIELGCIKAQGYGISRPMPFDDVLPWIARYQK